MIYKNASFGCSFRYNDYMKNIDHIFTTIAINDGLIVEHNGELVTVIEPVIPGINESRINAENGDFIIDCRLGYQVNENMKFGLIINNLLNREYMTRPATMMSPRTFAMQLALKI